LASRNPSSPNMVVMHAKEINRPRAD
jgi:hypothetical protein